MYVAHVLVSVCLVGQKAPCIVGAKGPHLNHCPVGLHSEHSA